MNCMYSYTDLVESLSGLGLGSATLVHLHSAVFPLGVMEGTPQSDIPRRIYRAFREVLGAGGTLTVAAAFEDYARLGVPYDWRHSPVDRAQGVLSQYVTGLPEAFRSFCPMSAVAGVGPLAEAVCHYRTGSAYGYGSAWEQLMERDAVMCFLGVRPSKAFTFTGYIQSRWNVPHFYTKLYTVPVFDDGVPFEMPITYPVRYRDPRFKIAENCDHFESYLEDSSLLISRPLGRGKVYVIPSVKAVFMAGMAMLQQDLFYFCKQRPEFVAGEIPTDGNTGSYVPDVLRLAAATNAAVGSELSS